MAGNKIFSSESGRAVAWTVFYVVFMWVVLYYLFNFNIFSVAHWTRLARVELHGFPGLVFGVLILAAVPMYVATTVLTMRNKSMPIKIPLPKCFEPVPKKEEPEPITPVVTEQETLPQLHAGVPAEMRESFMRARKNYGTRQMSVFNKPMVVDVVGAPSPVPAVGSMPVVENMAREMSNDGAFEDVSDGAFPVPADFDVEPSVESEYGVPVFSDINFDDDTENDSSSVSPIDDLCEFLTGAGYKPEKTENDLINVNNFVIAVHDDEDFWVADDENWFAAGKQKPSPIVALKNACAENNALRPVMYLAAQNIMDADAQIEKWRDDGTDVITERDELLNLIKKDSE